MDARREFGCGGRAVTLGVVYAYKYVSSMRPCRFKAERFCKHHDSFAHGPRAYRQCVPIQGQCHDSCGLAEAGGRGAELVPANVISKIFVQETPSVCRKCKETQSMNVQVAFGLVLRRRESGRGLR